MKLPILVYLSSLLLTGGLLTAAHHGDKNASCAEALLSYYFATQEALAGDNLENAQAAAKQLQAAQKGSECSDAIAEANDKILAAEDIKAARIAFKTLSDSLIPLIKKAGLSSHEAHLVHCPMAFDFTGASWLQKDKAVANPYFGAQMFACGVVKQSFGSEDK